MKRVKKKIKLMKSSAPFGEELDMWRIIAMAHVILLICNALSINSQKPAGPLGTSCCSEGAWHLNSKCGMSRLTAPVPREARILSRFGSKGPLYLLCCPGVARTKIHHRNSSALQGCSHLCVLKPVGICLCSAGPQLSIFRNLWSWVSASL